MAVKYTLGEMLPMVFAAIRFSLAATFLVAVVFIVGQNLHFHRYDFWRILLLGLVGSSIHQALFIEGAARTTASNAAILLATTPIFVTLLSALFRMERISGHVAAGVSISFLGILMVIGLGRGGVSFDRELLPYADPLLPCAGRPTIPTSRPLLRRYPPLKLTAISMLMGAPLLILLALGQFGQQDWQAITAQGWLGLVYSFVFSIALGTVVWNVSVSKMGNTRTAIFANVTPVVTVVASWLVLGETLGAWQIVGGGVRAGGSDADAAGAERACEVLSLMRSSSAESVAQPAQSRRLHIGWIDLSLLVVVLIWGIQYSAIKQAIGEVPPMVFASIRFALASLFITGGAQGRGEHLRFHRADLGKFVVLGLVGITICQTAFVQGLARTTASTLALLLATSPIFVTLLSGALGLEYITSLMALGVALSFGGTALIIGVGTGGVSPCRARPSPAASSACAAPFRGPVTASWPARCCAVTPRWKVTTLALLTGTPLLVLLRPATWPSRTGRTSPSRAGWACATRSCLAPCWPSPSGTSAFRRPAPPGRRGLDPDADHRRDGEHPFLRRAA